MDDTLFNAILSMDSYNRGYNAEIKFGTLGDNSDSAINGVTKIGNATIYDTDGDATAQSAGFYGIAYQNNTTGDITISYRGTDDALGLASGGDIINGWVAGTGDIANNQAGLAFQFYNSVVENSFDPDSESNPDISLTGHSLGGGLAGLVAEVNGLQDNVMRYLASCLMTAGMAASQTEPLICHQEKGKAR